MSRGWTGTQGQLNSFAPRSNPSDDWPVSIDGVVLCDCLETGVASPSPCPVIRDDVWIHAAAGYEAQQPEVRSWAETACSHRQFWLVDHQVRRMALLSAMDSYGGEDAFPSLHASLPTGNGGSVAAVDSARCRAAIHGLAAVKGRPMTSTWLGEDAVVRVHDADGSLLFAARAFVQERAGEDWIFRDDETGVTVRHCSPVWLWDGMPNEN